MGEIKLANAPCSWGTLEFEGLDGEQVEYDQMLDELVETGYRGTELGDWGYMPTDPPQLRAELERRELTMLGAFVPVALKDRDAHESGREQAIQVARLLDAVSDVGDSSHRPYIVLSDDNGSDWQRTQMAGRIIPSLGLSEEEWNTFAAGAERIAGAVRDETGLRTVFHHHCAGYVETPGEIERFLDMTDPELIGLVFDTGHFAYGAGVRGCAQVIEGLDRFSDRIWYMHFKDCDPDVAGRARLEGWDYFKAVEEGLFCELGDGCVDFKGVIDWLQHRDYTGWVVVEQDVLPEMGAPRESAHRNREYLRTLGL